MKIAEQLRVLIRHLKWGRLETNLALLGFLLISLGTWGLDRENLGQYLPEGWNLVTPAWFAGGLLVLVSTAKLWRLTTRPVDIPSPDGPVVRGASAFTPEDGEIFKRLGRQEELRKLRDWILDDQVPLVVIKGPSGVGKTSLLRAGVQNLTELDVAYWEAVASEPVERLLKAIRVQLDDPSRGVVLVDQGEQLGNDREVFDLLRTHLEADPPYRLTWVLAIRNEYMSDWIDWSQTQLSKEIRQRIEILPILPLSRQQATEIFSILADEVGLVLREEVREEVIRSIAEGDRVSPVDLAIALQVLTRNPRLAENPRFLLAIGGHSAMLTSYLEGELEYDQATRGEICRALLALIDLESDRRRAEGATVVELEQVARPTSSAVFAHALERLALPTVRVLEPLDNGRFRLVHERFIPAIRRLAGAVLSTAEQASRLLAQRCALWLRENEVGRFLLTSRELRAVERELPRLEWGKDRMAKERFLRRSGRRRRQYQAAILASLVLGVTLSGWGYRWWQAEQVRDQMASWGLPVGLYKALPQLRSLGLSQPVTDVGWLDRALHLEELALNAQRLQSLRGIPPSVSLLNLYLGDSPSASLQEIPPSLSRLVLEISGSQVSTVPEIPAGLSQLTLNLSGSQVSTIPEIPAGLSQLTLNLSGSQVSTIPEIPAGLSQLTLNLSGSQVSTVPEIPPSVSRLVLDLSGSQVSTVPEIPAGLSQLTLNLNESRIATVPEIPPGLSQLTLDLRDSQVATVPRIPASVSHLDLCLSRSRISTAPDIPAGVSQLTLCLDDSQVSTLPEIPASVSQLTFDLRFLQRPTLPEVPSTVSRLILDLRGSMISTLPEVPSNVSELTLTLDFSEISTLPEIPTNVSELNLYFRNSRISALPEIPSSISQLTLDLSDSRVSAIPEIPPSVSQLLLGLRSSRVSTLPEIPSGVSRLTLYLSDSQISTLGEIPASVRQLSIHLRESTVPDIPPSVSQLTLDFRTSLVSILPEIPPGVSRVTLDLTDSRISSLEGLPESAAIHLVL